MRSGNPSLGDAEIALLFQRADVNANGTVDFNEFVDFVYSEHLDLRGSPTKSGSGRNWRP